MKRVFHLFCLLCMAAMLSVTALAADTTTVWIYQSSSGQYQATTAGTASLEIDGEAVETDVDPFILDGRTLVPVRVVSEQLGADVDWDAETQRVTITTEEKTIILTIGSATALVNGVETALPDNVAPTLAWVDGGARTMVPVRFVSEQLGADVDWDNNSRTVIITPAKPSGTVLSITQQGNEVRIETDGALDETVFSLTGRLVVDLPGMLLTFNNGQLDLDGLAASALRYSQYDTGYTGYDRVVRLVFDLQDDASAGDISIAWVGNTLVCTLEEAASGTDTDASDALLDSGTLQLTNVSQSAAGEALPGDALPDDDADAEDADADDTDEGEDDEDDDADTSNAEDDEDASSDWDDIVLDPSTVSILLDAGHGGSDPGCQYYDTDERDITLSVTLKLGSILEDMGYQVLYTREDDTYVSLTDRSDMANQLGVTVFVSIHVNAAESEEANGIETYYWTEGTEDEALLASLVQEAVLETTGANDRGVRTANYWVIRKTDMPAILVETGFLSNYEEWQNLTSSSYQKALAQGIADGIDAFLQQYAG